MKKGLIGFLLIVTGLATSAAGDHYFDDSHIEVYVSQEVDGVTYTDPFVKLSADDGNDWAYGFTVIPGIIMFCIGLGVWAESGRKEED